MKLTPEIIEKIAELSRLSVTEAEKTYYAEQLSVIFDYIEMLDEVDTSAVLPTVQMSGLVDQVRADQAVPASIDVRRRLLQAFPEQEGGLLKVKAVFEKK